MTNMGNTEDTQRPACTLISTPVGSWDSGGQTILSQITRGRGLTTWFQTWRNSDQYCKQCLFRKVPTNSGGFVTSVRSTGIRSFQENSKKSRLRKITAHSSPPIQHATKLCFLEKPRSARCWSPSPDLRIPKELWSWKAKPIILESALILGESLGGKPCSLYLNTTWNSDCVVFPCAVYSMCSFISVKPY